MSFLAKVNDYNVVDIPGTMFRKGFVVADWLRSEIDPLIKGGNLYGGFRAFPASLSRNRMFQESPKVLLVRDPRDALVSQYFSDAYSHALPENDEQAANGRDIFLRKRSEALSTSIDEFVLKHARNLCRVLMDYQGLLSDSSCLTFRYEDVVFTKRDMIGKVIAHFDWSCPDRMIDRILELVDEFPAVEEPKAFVRKVVPGDHLQKLSPATVAKLNDLLKDPLKHFGYSC